MELKNQTLNLLYLFSILNQKKGNKLKYYKFFIKIINKICIKLDIKFINIQYILEKAILNVFTSFILRKKNIKNLKYTIPYYITKFKMIKNTIKFIYSISNNIYNNILNCYTLSIKILNLKLKYLKSTFEKKYNLNNIQKIKTTFNKTIFPSYTLFNIYYNFN